MYPSTKILCTKIFCMSIYDYTYSAHICEMNINTLTASDDFVRSLVTVIILYGYESPLSLTQALGIFAQARATLH